MKRWKLDIQYVDRGTQLGVCVGEYDDEKPIIRHAVRGYLNIGTPEHKVLAYTLRHIADWLDEAYELRKNEPA